MEQMPGVQGGVERRCRDHRGFIARRGVAAATALALGGLAALAVAAPQAGAALPGRDSDPVVMKGADVPALEGTAPERIVGFRFQNGKWKQIPVQVDERAEVDLRKLYPGPSGDYTYVYNDEPFLTETYTDPDTLAGPDPDPGFDAGDELALMARDTGKRARGAGAPDGVKGEGTEVEVDDPIEDGTSSGRAFVYLFESKGGKGALDPSAGKKYVDYRFRLQGSPEGESTYLDDYDFRNGPNPENSTVNTPYYSTRSIDRWVDTELKLKGGGATDVDILDRDKAMFYPGFCGRSEDTFSGLNDQGPKDEEGSFVINKSGPIRAIRSYIGANSGPYVNREHIYYERRQDSQTILRVHAIPNVMSFIDYSPAATGMTYRNELNPAGVTVDGVPDSLTPGVPGDVTTGGSAWEQMSGEQGTVSIVTSMIHDFDDISVTNYYLDEKSPGGGAETQCTGDAFAYGASGAWINSPLPNTDPVVGPAKNLTAKRTFFYDAPGEGGAGRAARREQEVANPLTVQARDMKPGKPKLKLKVRPSKVKAEPGDKVRLKAKIRNTGNADAKRLRLCTRGAKRAINGDRGCLPLDSVAAGEGFTIRGAFKVKKSAKQGKVKLRISVKAKGAKRARDTVKIRIR